MKMSFKTFLGSMDMHVLDDTGIYFETGNSQQGCRKGNGVNSIKLERIFFVSN